MRLLLTFCFLCIISLLFWPFSTYAQTGEYFTVDVVGETFVFYTTNPETIEQATRAFHNEYYAHPHGKLLRGQKDYNHPWSWYMDPENIQMAEVSMELCDGRPSYVEQSLDYWVDIVGYFCPWDGKIVGIGLPPESSSDPSPRIDPRSSPDYGTEDLKELLVHFFDSSDLDYEPKDLKVNSLDAAFIILGIKKTSYLKVN